MEPEYKVGDVVTVDDGYLQGNYEIQDIADEDPQGLDDPKWRFCYWVSVDGSDYPIYGGEIKGKAE